MMTIPTIAIIREQILSDIDASTGQTAPRLPRSVWYVLATAIAGAMWLLYRFGLSVARQIFTATADAENLVTRGSEYGLTRTSARRWIGTADATGTDGTAVPVGTTFALDGHVYDVTALATISGGVATLSMRSLETGDAVDLDVGDVLAVTSPIAGLDSDVAIATVTQSGEDAEDIEVFRARVLQRQQATPQGGAIPDWIGWALEVSGIAEAIVERPDAGFVNVYPLTDDPDPANRIPDGAKIAEVQTYLTDTSRAPIRAAAVTVVAPAELDFDVDIADLSPNDATTKAAILAAVTSYMYARRPKQYTGQAIDRSVVSAAAITSIAIGAGANVATVVLKDAGGTPITSYALDYSELAVLRTLTWT